MNLPDKSAKILIVDDAASLRAVLRSLFSSQGYAVTGELASGAGVMTAIERTSPDIVCLDYNLPDTNGIELLKCIKERFPTIAVVIITGALAPELETAAAEAGAAGFIRKPFTQDRILQEMEQIAKAQALHQRHAAGQSPAVDRPKAKAVVVDDSNTMRVMLSSILVDAGVDVVGQAADGKEAIEVVAQHNPDIVCLDMDMPVMNGLEALAEIHQQHPQCQVLMVTGHTARDTVMQAAKLGARGYIIKPFAPAKVSEAINKLLAAR